MGSVYLPLPFFSLCYFTDLLITLPLLLKTLVLWPTVFCGFSNSMDEALGTPHSQLLHLHSPSFLSHLLPHHNPAWQDLKCLSFNFSLSFQLTCWQIPIVASPPLHYSLDYHHFLSICQLHFPPCLIKLLESNYCHHLDHAFDHLALTPLLLYPKSFTPMFVCTQLNKWFKWVDFFHFKYSISNFLLIANASLDLSDSLVDFPSHYTRLLFHTCSILNTLTPPPSLFSVDELTLLFMRK